MQSGTGNAPQLFVAARASVFINHGSLSVEQQVIRSGARQWRTLERQVFHRTTTLAKFAPLVALLETRD